MATAPARTAQVGVVGTGDPCRVAIRDTRCGARYPGAPVAPAAQRGAGMGCRRTAPTPVSRLASATGTTGCPASGSSGAVVQGTTCTPSPTVPRTCARSVTGAAAAPPVAPGHWGRA